jgi:HlyD family secretion protein
MFSILKKTQGWKFPLIAFAGLIFALVTVLGRQPAPANEPIVQPPIAPYANTVSGIGVVEPQSESINIGTELSGIVRHIAVKVGQNVKAGDPLFTLDERSIEAQIRTLESSLEIAKIDAEDAAVQFDIVKNIGSKSAISKEDFSRRKFAALSAEARMIQAEAQLAEARISKERMTVRAPIDGQILSVNLRAGEFAPAGANNTDPLIRMGNTDSLHVRVEIDEENAGRITPDAPAKATKRGDTKEAITLKFVRFEPFIRPKQNLAVSGQRVDTRVLQVIYAMDKKESQIFVGEQMDVFIEQK